MTLSPTDLSHIALLREMIDDAEARIGELEARKQFHLSWASAERVDSEIEEAKRERRRLEKALFDDYGLTYEDGIPKMEPITRTCAEGLKALERVERELREDNLTV
jgi:hypothetical protein